jgi:hypothetical protein
VGQTRPSRSHRRCAWSPGIVALPRCQRHRRPWPPPGERAAVGAWRRIHAARTRAPGGEGVAIGGVAAPHARPVRDPVFALRPVEQRVPAPDGTWVEQPVLLRLALCARPDVLVGHAVALVGDGAGNGFAETAVGIARAGWLIRDWLLALGWGSAAKAGATPMAATASTTALASGRRVMKRFIVVSDSCCSDVSVRGHPHGSVHKDRSAEVCLRSDHGITSFGLLLDRASLRGRPEVRGDVCDKGAQGTQGVSHDVSPGGCWHCGIPRPLGSRPASLPHPSLVWQRMVRQRLRQGFRMVIERLEGGRAVVPVHATPPRKRGLSCSHL